MIRLGVVRASSRSKDFKSFTEASEHLHWQPGRWVCRTDCLFTDGGAEQCEFQWCCEPVSPGAWVSTQLGRGVQAQPTSQITGNQPVLHELQDIEAKKEAQKEKEIDEQEANASTFHRSRTPLDKDLINTGIYESSGKQCLPLVQLIQQLLR